MSKMNCFPWCVWQLCSYVGINICSAVSFDYAIANTGVNISVYNFLQSICTINVLIVITTAFCKAAITSIICTFSSGTNQSQLFTVIRTDIACNNHIQKIVANIKEPMVLIWI